MKLRRLVDDAGPIGWCHYCPGCRHMHCINVEQPTRPYPEFNYAGGVQWSFNGNVDRPSFTPSMLISTGGWKRPDGSEVPKVTLCHYVMTDGVINYCADSAHELKGQAVALPDLPDVYLEPAGKPRAKAKKRKSVKRERGAVVVQPTAMPFGHGYGTPSGRRD